MWIALALCLAARIALIPLDEERLYLDGDEGSRSYLVTEQRYRVRGPAAPEVVVLGTSRLLDLEPDALAVHGVGGPIALLPQPGNTFYDAELLLARNPGLVAQCELLVVDLVPTMLRVDPWAMERKFLRFASVADRAAVPGPGALRALADWLFPLVSERHSAAQWIEGISLWWRPPAERLRIVEQRWRSTIAFNRRQSALRRRQSGIEYNPYTLEFVAPAGEGGRWHPRQLEALDRSLAALPERCRPVFVFLPFRASLQRAIEREPARLERWREFRALGQTLAARGARVSWNEDAAALGLRDEDYVDGIHFTPRGNAKLARLLAGLIARAREAAPPPGPALQ